jgi:hypothetical protein
MKTLFVLAALSGSSPDHSYAPDTRSRLALACEFIGDQVSGDERICTYNCVGSHVTQSVKVTEICPPSIDR